MPLPPGETLRRAILFVIEQREADPQASLWRLVEEASVRFDLSPAQEEQLLQSLRTPSRSPADR